MAWHISGDGIFHLPLARLGSSFHYVMAVRPGLRALVYNISHTCMKHLANIGWISEDMGGYGRTWEDMGG